LEKQSETFKAQTLFLQSVSTLDAKQLMAFHHEIALNSGIIDNYLAKAMKVLRSSASPPVSQLLEKISLANKRITAIAQYATKANFKSASNREITDVPSFVEQYINNVAKDFVGSGLHIDVKNEVHSAFEIKLRRLELSIVVDNVVSNSVKAQSSRLDVLLTKRDDHVLQMSFADDGKGLSSGISSPEVIFDLGVTTTSGSGLGLFHAKQIIQDLGGTIRAIPQKRGLCIMIEMMR
jgi:signal transduction histidine kinase